MGPGPGGGMGRGRGRWAAEARTTEAGSLEARLAESLSPRMLALAAAAYAFAMGLGLALAQTERAEGRAEAALEGLRAEQARALQGQMNPHALFNLVSALTEMARESPAGTEAALVSLAELLRRLLDHNARASAPLADERRLVEAYLAVESIRLGPRLRVAWDWDAAAAATEAPPMLLQPLVENAIKHGVAPSRTGGDLRIGLRREGERLLLRVANTGAPLVAGRPDGVGLANLRQRLDLLGAGDFRLAQEDGWTVAELPVPRGVHG